MQGNTPDRKRNADTVRDSRIRLRGWLWDHSAPATALRVSECGRKRISELVQLRSSADSAGLGGVSTCGSVWACPMCSAKVAQTRSDEVQDTIRAWQARGGSVVLATFTLAHRVTTPLRVSWDAVGDGWAAVRNGSGWVKDSRDFGIGGYCRVIEVTRSWRNGWHPHVHVLLFVQGAPTPAECEALRSRLFSRWSARLARDGFKTQEFDKRGHAVGVDVRVASAHDVAYLADYLTKFGYVPKGSAEPGETSWTLAREVSRGDLKQGRKGSRTPWEILEEAASGHKGDRRLWHEWESASKGRRQYAWALGFRESLNLAELETDEQAAVRVDARLSTVALLPATSWALLVADLRSTRHAPGRSVLSQALAVSVGDETGEAVRDFLGQHGIASLDPAAFVPEGPGISDEFDPVLVPGREFVTFNHLAQSAREATRPGAGRRALVVRSEPWISTADECDQRPLPSELMRPVPPLPLAGSEAARIRALYGV